MVINSTVPYSTAGGGSQILKRMYEYKEQALKNAYAFCTARSSSYCYSDID